MSERDLLNDIRMQASHLGARLFRNNVGIGWAGRLIKHVGGSVTLLSARPLHAGLCIGSSDLVGWMPYTIKTEDVGRTVALFCAVEVKWGGTVVTNEQAAFIMAVKMAGGLAGVVRDTETALDALKNYRPAQGSKPGGK